MATGPVHIDNADVLRTMKDFNENTEAFVNVQKRLAAFTMGNTGSAGVAATAMVNAANRFHESALRFEQRTAANRDAMGAHVESGNSISYEGQASMDGIDPGF